MGANRRESVDGGGGGGVDEVGGGWLCEDRGMGTRRQEG